MLRKLAHIIAALLMLVSTMGVTVSKHYCGTRLVDVSINGEADSCCDDIGTSKCCHNETKHYQVEDEFNFVVDITISQPIEFIAPIIFMVIPTLTEPLVEETYVEVPPPLPMSIRLSFMQSYLC